MIYFFLSRKNTRLVIKLCVIFWCKQITRQKEEDYERSKEDYEKKTLPIQQYFTFVFKNRLQFRTQ